MQERNTKLKEYYIKCFITEISKIIIFLLIFVYMGLTTEYLIALFFLMLLRSNGGGLHFNHYASCLVISFMFLYGSIYLAQHITPPTFSMYLSIIICAITGYHLVPITCKKRPKATTKQVQRCKNKTTVIIILFILLICFCPHNTYFFIGFWTIILHILQLIAAKLIERRQK